MNEITDITQVALPQATRTDLRELPVRQEMDFIFARRARRVWEG